MAEKTLENQNTLVRYNNPTLVIKHEDKKGEKDVRNHKLVVSPIFKVFSPLGRPKEPEKSRSRKHR
jgi:hypothetical protein